MSKELWSEANPVYIPEISNEEIAAMRHIEPVLRVYGSDFYRRIEGIHSIDPRGVSFLWDAKPSGEQMVFHPLNLVRIMTFHTFGAPVLFKPSLAEVYAGIRRMLPDWSGVRFFHLHSENMGPANVLGDCHWCVCDLFGDAAHLREHGVID